MADDDDAREDDSSEDEPKPKAPPKPSKGSAHDALLSDPALRKLIRAILRAKGIPQQHLDDLTQDVLVALVIWSRDEATGSGAEDIAAGARTIARTVAAGFWRKTGVAGKHMSDDGGESDGHEAPSTGSTVDPVDMRKIFVEINALIASGAISAKCAALLDAIANDKTLVEHAEETGQKPEAVRKMRERTQEKVEERLKARKMTDVGLLGLFNRNAAFAMAAAVAIVFGLLAYQGRLAGILDIPLAWGPKPPPRPEVPAPPPPSIEAIAKALAPPVDERDQSDKAAHELLQAEQDYKNFEWDDCIRHVGEAKALDPHVGDAPELSRGCAAEKEKDMDAKTGRRHRPKR